MGKGVRLAVWMDVHPLMHLRIHRPFVSVMDSRSSYPRLFPPYTSLTSYYAARDSRDSWPSTTTTTPKSPTNPHPRFPLFSDDVNSLSSPIRVPQVPPSSTQTGTFPRAVEIPRSQPPLSSSSSSGRKWTATDLENYFTQMRISTPTQSRTRDVLAKAADNMSTLRSMHPHRLRSELSSSTRQQPGLYVEDGGAGRKSPVSPGVVDTDSSSGGESCSLGTSSASSSSATSAVPERNRIVFEKVMIGLDKRTTVMIKNVPNKYTQVTTSTPNPAQLRPHRTVGWKGIDGAV
jgi:hypothetical protein